MEKTIISCVAFLLLLKVIQAACPVPALPNHVLYDCWDDQGRPLQTGEVTFPSNASCQLHCRFDSKADNSSVKPFVILICWKGYWEGGELPCRGTSSESASNTGVIVRKKRFIGLLILAAIPAISYLVGREFTRDRTPPQLRCPNVPTTLSDPRQTSTVVTWQEPSKAFDAEEKADVSVVRTTPMGPGWVFVEGTTKVGYKAKDGSGNEARCITPVIVQVARCRGPMGVEHGYHVCVPGTSPPRSLEVTDDFSRSTQEQDTYVRGTECTYGCYEGYRMHGPAPIKCIASDEWSHSVPTCKPVECPPLIDPAQGSHTCTADIQFLSVCSFSCIHGYAIQPGTSSVLVCGADGTWRGTPPRCRDSEPPRWEECHTLQTLLVDKGENSSLATWREPVAKDNSGEDILPEYHSSVRQGEPLGAGLYYLNYSAQDSAGNAAKDCVITLVVKVLTCPQHFAKPYQRVECPNGNRHGASCFFSCDTGFRLNGSDVSDCVMSDTSPPYALWKWNHGTAPECVPAEVCERLPAPTNGALACDAWEDGNFCKAYCHKGFDVPDSFLLTPVRRLLVCLHNPTQGLHWNYPDPLPECSPVTPGQGLVLDANFSYFTGSCFEEDVRRQIKENFISYMNNKSIFVELCLNNPACSVQNVEVTCGSVRERGLTGTERRQRREAAGPFQVVLTFQFRVAMSESLEPRQNFLELAKTASLAVSTLHEKLTRSFDDVMSDLDNASLPQSRLLMESGPPLLECPSGTLPSYNSSACVECPRGSYFDDTTKTCVPCPLGQYQNTTGQRQCVPCPQHFTTRQTAATNLRQCLAQCPPGQISAEGVVPCSPCARGYYQPQHGQTSCLSCPLSQATLHEGAQARAECQDFDLTFPKDADASMTLDILDHNITLPLTSALWFRAVALQNASILRLSWDNHELAVQVSDSSAILSVDEDASLKISDITSGQWHHLAVEVGENLTSVLLTRIQKSRSVNSSLTHKTSLVSSSLVSSSIVSLTLGGQGFAGTVSQLNVWSAQGSTSFPTPTPRCQQPEGGEGNVVNWRALLQARDTGVVPQSPSLCDDTDECGSSPCIHGDCSDDLGDFRCTCHPGFTGKACDVNIDDCVTHLCNHDSTCVDEVMNYTCICPPLYTGTFCDDVITDGSWGLWSAWSACSVTCGEGEHFRWRRCDSPSPQNGGLPCEGNATQMQACNDRDCPECPDLVEPEHGELSCKEEEDGMIHCTLECQEDFDFDVEPLPEYTCGWLSNYTWNFQTDTNPGRRFPNCREVQPAAEVTTVYSATYLNLTCNSRAFAAEASARITEVMQDVTGNMECLSQQRCRVVDHVVIDCNPNDVTRTQSDVRAGLAITVANNPNAVGLQTGIEDTVAAIRQLNASGHSGDFKVIVQGQEFDLDLSSGHFSGRVFCQPGSTKVNYYCVPCGPGTFWQNGSCLRCPVGTFQGEGARNSCLPCPPGRSTPGEASVSSQECSVEVASSSSFPFILGVSLAPVAAVIAIFIIIAVVVICRRRSNSTYSDLDLTVDQIQLQQSEI